jgi:hypothetical protein
MARTDKKLFQLGADEVENIERAEELFQFLCKHTLEDGVAFVKGRWGVDTSLRAMSIFKRDWPLERVVFRLQGRIAASKRISGEAAEEVASLTPTNLKLLEQQITELLASGADEKRLASFVRMFSTLTRAADIPEQTRLDARKLKLLEDKAAKADEAEKVTADPALSDAERAQRYKRIFGLAA